MKAITAILCLTVGFVAGRITGSKHEQTQTMPMPTVQLIHDTVRVIEPQYVHSVETQRVEVPMAVAHLDTADAMPADSIIVEIPVESRQYVGESYRAYVSGWRPRLDSLILTRSVAAVTVSPATQQHSRFSAGIQAGVGLTPKGLQPYVGIGLTLRLCP